MIVPPWGPRGPSLYYINFWGTLTVQTMIKLNTLINYSISMCVYVDPAPVPATALPGFYANARDMDPSCFQGKHLPFYFAFCINDEAWRIGTLLSSQA